MRVTWSFPWAKPLACLAAGCALLIQVEGAWAAQPRSTGIDAQASRVADRILAAILDANGVPGMAAAVWHNGDIAWTGTAGYRDLETRRPVEDGTVFRLASVSKIFAVVAAARLREQGKLDVDRPVQTILDQLDPKWPPLTARQLAAHMSGIPHYQDVDDDRGGYRFKSVRESVGVFNGRDLLFPPGTGYNYSSYGYTLLSAVVEQAAGKPYLDYLSSDLVDGLTIGPDATDDGTAATSTAYNFDNGVPLPAPPHDYSYSWGGAGLSATAGDLARFGGRLLSETVISDATLAWMLEPSRLTDGTPVMDDGFPVGFGLRGGTDQDGERIAHHSGATIGARSVLLLYPDRELAVSILSNAPWVSSIEQTAMVLSAPFRRGTSTATATPCPTQAKTYDGVHNGEPVRGTVSFTVEDGVCSATLSTPKALAGWFHRVTRKDSKSLRIISLDGSGAFGRAALITPFGAYDLRPADQGGSHSVRFNASRSLTISFR